MQVEIKASPTKMYNNYEKDGVKKKEMQFRNFNLNALKRFCVVFPTDDDNDGRIDEDCAKPHPGNIKYCHIQ